MLLEKFISEIREIEAVAQEANNTANCFAFINHLDGKINIVVETTSPHTWESFSVPAQYYSVHAALGAAEKAISYLPSDKNENYKKLTEKLENAAILAQDTGCQDLAATLQNEATNLSKIWEQDND